jgi:hypothetical protein
VALAVPSRGIDRLAEAVAAVVHALRHVGAEPFIVPAMGSHGGGDAPGQIAQLERQGIREETVGAPLRSPAPWVEVAGHDSGEPLLLPACVRDADGLLLINRVKLHTLFTGPVQSGLGKILVFGLGGPRGADAAHGHARGVALPASPLLATLAAALPRVLAAAPPAGGLALVEDESHALTSATAVSAGDFIESDRRLLAIAAAMHPRLPLSEGALLIVEEMGKDISGTGMDPHVIGRSVGKRTQGGGIQQIFVRRLTAATHGNAHGIGMVDHTLRALVEQMDPETTLLNSRTSGMPDRARIPTTYDTDEAAVRAALDTASPGPIMQIRNTLDLGEALIGGLPMARLQDLGLTIVEKLPPPYFDPGGTLVYRVR